MTPAPTTATRSTGSIARIRLSRATPSTMLPASGTDPPERPLPIARGVMAIRRASAWRWIAATSAVEPGRTTSGGVLAKNVPSKP